ncbi:Fic family protein [Gulosibacter sp. 10]|uniref:Fic family protein n=1 Tax=Gulosibacter sp. 10 TaxID=1255570 RepID=UPI00097F48EE|nr:Fic family protein [Gulosibacter sp. 10]SJM59413.1 MloA [Gulosibacter sp. 10]
MRVRSLPGTYIGSSKTGRPRYTPPEGAATIRDKLGQWEEFVHSRDELDPLVIMAAAHYQFEAIHPFADGNGRTGRILNILMLVERGLLEEPVLYLSRYIIRRKEEYYDRLLAVTEHGAWEEWPAFMLAGVEDSCREALELISTIQYLQRAMPRELRDTVSTADADLPDLLFERPYCRIQDVMDRCGVSRPTATNWLNRLVDSGALTSTRAGRHRLFINHRFLDALAA